MPPVTWRINEQDHVEVGGVDTLALAREYGTPLYVLCEATLKEKLEAYVRPLAARGGRVYYAGKALLTPWLARMFHRLGAGIDVVSGGELYLCLRAGVPGEDLLLHGNNKTEEELRLALEAGVGRIVVDGFGELRLLGRLAQEMGKQPRILLRVNPGIEAHTHEFIRTGQLDSKFGFPIATGQAEEAVRLALSLPHVRLVGLHSHIGSQILDLEPFLVNAEVMMEFSRALFRRHGFWPEELDLGGGLGIVYTPEDDPPSIPSLVEGLLSRVEEGAAVAGLPAPRLLLEPGRSVVGEAGITLYTVGERKEIPGVRTYVSVDGGMGDNPRPALYGAVYQAVAAGRATAPPEETITLAGRNCESGDILIHRAQLPRLDRGDVVAVLATGAYNHSMASTYNRVPRPAMVLVAGGEVLLLQRRETYEDLLSLERMPEDARVLP